MMMILGMFVFSLPTLAYHELQRQTEWKHASTARVGLRDAHQYVGPGDDTITLSGWVAPELTGSPPSRSASRTRI
jgi:phage protein U